ncbi:MAG TPA: hypothetical protein VFK33_06535 [Bacillales bacterium]|nr:hypothetical protein [Bacillales bacterium]
MTKAQMHVFNWFFLFIMVVVAAVHTLVADFQQKAVWPGLYLFLLGFAIIWLIIYAIQLKSFDTKKWQTALAANGILTGFWVIVYAFINAA